VRVGPRDDAGAHPGRGLVRRRRRRGDPGRLTRRRRDPRHRRLRHQAGDAAQARAAFAGIPASACSTSRTTSATSPRCIGPSPPRPGGAAGPLHLRPGGGPGCAAALGDGVRAHPMRAGWPRGSSEPSARTRTPDLLCPPTTGGSVSWPPSIASRPSPTSSSCDGSTQLVGRLRGGTSSSGLRRPRFLRAAHSPVPGGRWLDRLPLPPCRGGAVAGPRVRPPRPDRPLPAERGAAAQGARQDRTASPRNGRAGEVRVAARVGPTRP
jgi:hypothetical protein